MKIELTIDGVAVGTIRGLAYLADTMSRLRPGQAVVLESDGTERFLADRIEALARRRHQRIAWEGRPTEHTLRFRLEPSTSPAEPAQTATRLGPGAMKPEQRDVGTEAQNQHPPTAPTGPQHLENPVRTGSATSMGLGSESTHLSELPLESGRPDTSIPRPHRPHGLAGDPGEPTAVSPEGDVVPLFGPRRGRPPRWLKDARDSYLAQPARQ
jgi:hypothetical protein